VDFEIADSTAEGGLRKQTWHYPSRAECMVCHSRAVNYVLGLTENQMNRVHDYGSEKVNQLQMLSELGFFKAALPKPIEELSKLPDPFDASVDLHQRATAYLHTNCANCHVEAGGGNAQFSVEVDAKPEAQRLIDAPPVHTNFGISDARLVAPGAPERSLLFQRIQRRGHGQMPPIGTNVPDKPAIELMREWILQLPSTAEIPAAETPNSEGAKENGN